MAKYAHTSVQKAIKLLILITGLRSYTKLELMEKLDISERTFFNYIRTLKEAGFVVDFENGYYTIPKNSQQYGSLSDLLHFSEEEAYILNEAIHNIEANTKDKEQLISKLSALYDSDRIAIPFIKKENSSKIKPLLKAIKGHKKVLLVDYHSSGSGQISTRKVEPFEFTHNYILLWCYEISSNTNKLFKISRIQKIEELKEEWEYEQNHKSNFLDCFRMAGENKFYVKMKMSLKAKNLMVEEYPLSDKFISSQSEDSYIFDGWITLFDGIARFILGLPGEFWNIQNEELTIFLKKKRNIDK